MTWALWLCGFADLYPSSLLLVATTNPVCQSRQLRDSPVNPLSSVPIEPAIRLRHIRRHGRLPEEELIEKRRDLGVLRARHRAVRVPVRRLRHAHGVLGAQALVHHARGHGAPVRADGAQVVDAGVLDDEERARRHQRHQHVVVVRQHRGVGRVLGEGRREPRVPVDDLRRVFRLGAVLLDVRYDAPAPRSAAAAFLREDERDAVVEGAGDEGALAVRMG